MRKINSIITIIIIVLFVIHMVYGTLVLLRLTEGGNQVLRIITRIMFTCIAVHVGIVLKLTADSITAMRRSGVSYFKENRLFWVRRFSGFALIAFIIVHALVLQGEVVGNMFLLQPFDLPRLIAQILLVVSLMLHLVTNIRPLKISMGLDDKKNIRTDIALVLSVLLLIAGIAFIIYFVRWMVI